MRQPFKSTYRSDFCKEAAIPTQSCTDGFSKNMRCHAMQRNTCMKHNYTGHTKNHHANNALAQCYLNIHPFPLTVSFP